MHLVNPFPKFFLLLALLALGGFASLPDNTGRSEINALMTARGYRLAEALGVDHVYLRA